MAKNPETTSGAKAEAPAASAVIPTLLIKSGNEKDAAAEKGVKPLYRFLPWINRAACTSYAALGAEIARVVELLDKAAAAGNQVTVTVGSKTKTLALPGSPWGSNAIEGAANGLTAFLNICDRGMKLAHQPDMDKARKTKAGIEAEKKAPASAEKAALDLDTLSVG